MIGDWYVKQSLSMEEFYFTAGGDLKLKVVSGGNFIDGVNAHRFAGPKC